MEKCAALTRPDGRNPTNYGEGRHAGKLEDDHKDDTDDQTGKDS
jgi:hypothetical protein